MLIRAEFENNTATELKVLASERETLIAERCVIEERMKLTGFIDPADLRRSEEITSLLLSGGASDEIRLRACKIKKSRRVTSFTRDRR